jgi:hypothetical protein
MKTIENILRTHPRAETLPVDEIKAAADALFACMEACTSCADACLAEENPVHLRRCIRADQDCADICSVTVRLIVRQTETIAEMVRQQLHASIIACQLCAEECERHEHAHCRLCAGACRRAQAACNRLLGQISSAGTITAEPLDESMETNERM